MATVPQVARISPKNILFPTDFSPGVGSCIAVRFDFGANLQFDPPYCARHCPETLPAGSHRSITCAEGSGSGRTRGKASRLYERTIPGRTSPQNAASQRRSGGGDSCPDSRARRRCGRGRNARLARRHQDDARFRSGANLSLFTLPGVDGWSSGPHRGGETA